MEGGGEQGWAEFPLYSGLQAKCVNRLILAVPVTCAIHVRVHVVMYVLM